ncbi:MAG: DUF4157 domain-containing protein, partial [Kofleriaceae bacterium]
GSTRVGGHGVHGDLGASVERGADGETRGASGRLGGGYRGVSASGGAGYRCFAERAVQDPADRTRFTVAWTISITRQFAAEFHIGGSASDELERTGTEVFRATSPTEAGITNAQQRAQIWRDGFQSRSADQVREMFTSGSIGHDTTVAFWRAAEVDTQRAVRVRSRSARPARRSSRCSRSACRTGRWQTTATVHKIDARHVDVTQTAEVRHGGGTSGGTFGSELTAGGRVVGTARVVTRVELEGGAVAFGELLAQGRDLEEHAPAIVVRERTRTEGTVSTSGSGFGPLGVEDESTTSRETGTRLDETSAAVPIDVFHGEHVHTETGGFQSDSTGVQVDAPAAGQATFVVRHAITGRDAATVRRELAEATHVGDSPTRGHAMHAGTWTIVEEFTQAQIAQFCTGYVAHFEEIGGALGRDLEHVGQRAQLFGLEIGGGSAYDQLYHRLRDLRGATSEAAQRIRAQAITSFLCATGQEASVSFARGSHATGTAVVQRADARRRRPQLHVARGAPDARRADSRLDGLAERGGATGVDAAVNDLQRALNAMRERRDQVDAQERYASLPLATRHDLVSGYEHYITQLEGLATRLRGGQDSEIAGNYGSETQEAYRAMEANRAAVGALRAETGEMRAVAVDHRRHFGQEDSEEWQARLGASARTRTTRLWTQAEASRRVAEQHVASAEHVLEDTRLAPSGGGSRLEETMTALYHRARTRFGEAVEAYEVCRERCRELDQLYVELAATEATSVTEAPDAEATAATRREHAPDSATGARTHVPTTEEQRAVVEPARLHALVSRDGIAVAVRHADVAMSSGLRVRVTRHQVPATTEAGIAANGGTPVIFHLQIVQVATGFESFLSPMFGAVHDGDTGMARQVHTWDRVENRAGVAFSVLTFVALEGASSTTTVARAATGDAIGSHAEAAIGAATSSAGSPLPGGVKGKFEASLGVALDAVRVHTGASSESAAGSVGARAYATGQDIHFGAGQFDPASGTGEHLLAHGSRIPCSSRAAPPGRSTSSRSRGREMRRSTRPIARRTRWSQVGRRR